MNLIAELRRRSIYRVAGVYAVIGWLVAQVAVVLETAFALPGWFDGVIIAAVIVGFPVALVLAWAFEVTPEGIRRIAPADGGAPPRPVAPADAAIVVALAAVLGVSLYQAVKPASAPPIAAAGSEATGARGLASPDAAPSIAVLAFEDLSPEGDQEYFSDGIAEEILNVLARIDGLEVASRTSSFAFKGQEEIGVPVIADELGVRHVLEGSVRTAGDMIRITAQLIDAQEDRHLWSENFNRTLSTENIFAIQDEIANAIVESLRGPMGLADAPSPTVERRADTDSLDAYELYLEANALFVTRSQADPRVNIPKSIGLFEQAVAIDPNFARGWAGLAAAASVGPGWNLTDRDYRTLAIEAAERAIALNPRLSLPYAALGEVHAYIEPKDFGQAMELLDRAIALDPQDASAHMWRGEVLTYLGFFDDANADFDACLALDPSYTFCRRNLAVVSILQGDDARGLELYADALINGYRSGEIPIFAHPLVNAGRDTALLQQIQLHINNYVGLTIASWAIDPIYRAVVDPDFDRAGELARLEARLRAVGVAPEDNRIFRNSYSYLFGNYAAIEPYVYPYHWFPRLTAPENDAEQRRMIEFFDLPAYWRAHGFPPQCRPVGADDYACD